MLHETLRELIAARGPAVVDDADELRGALDDFVGEHEATPGEINLLVDAVRLGAVRRLLAVLDRGASVPAAIADAGDALARDRGSDDAARSRWAVAVLGHALGRVDATSLPDPTSPYPNSAPAPAPAPAAAPALPPPPPTHQAAPSPPGPTHPAPAWEQPRRRSRAGLVVLAACLLVAAVIGAAALLWPDGADQRPDGSGGPAASGSTDGSGSATGALAATELVTSFTGEGDVEKVYRVSTTDGSSQELTDGPSDELPNVSPDRRTVIYLDTSGAGRVPMVLDLASRETTPLFGDAGPCQYAGRPAWSPSGSRLVVLCESADQKRRDLYVADWDGQGAVGWTSIGRDDRARETPTWVDDTAFVFIRLDKVGATSTGIWWRQAKPGAKPDHIGPITIDGKVVSHPSYSPARDKILFLVHDDDGEAGRLWMMGADGFDAEERSTRLVAHPAWSPDGKELVFTDGGVGDRRLLIAHDWADPDDAEPLPLSDAPGFAGIPAWSSR